MTQDFTGLPAELSGALIESRWADALVVTDRLLEQTVPDARLWFIRGVLLRLAWRMDEAMAAYERSIDLAYEGAGPFRELFQHLEKRGRIAEALAIWQLAFERGWSDKRFHSLALDACLKDPATEGEHLVALHRTWCDLYAQPLPDVPPLAVEPFDGTRPLRVGYVCSFWEAPTIRYMLHPVLRRHDARRVRATLYVSGPLMMGETWRELYAPYVAAIREVHSLDDRAFIERVRGDGIDVLIDLNGHSGAQRFSAMASRCAPVQAVYLNYTSTTALENMDYVIGDEWSPPPGTEHTFTEAVQRLSGCFFCFDYSDDPMLPAVERVPAEKNGFVTFGCFGARTKINPTLVGWWAELLQMVPRSRLFIRNFELSPADNRRALERDFARHGIDPSRLRLLGKGTRHEVVHSYGDVDVALDTYPYCGGNTTAEALWQGVPVVTLRGRRFSSSYGASLLHGAGCPELIADTPRAYIDKAAQLAASPERLGSYRRRLRGMVREHGLGNADIFTPQFEAALIGMRMRAVVTT